MMYGTPSRWAALAAATKQLSSAQAQKDGMVGVTRFILSPSGLKIFKTPTGAMAIGNGSLSLEIRSSLVDKSGNADVFTSLLGTMDLKHN